MGLWYIQLNYIGVLKTTGIGLAVILLGLLIFHLLWLRCPFLEVPTSYQNNKYLFDNEAGFFTKMKVLIFDLLNHNYWITNVGFDGKVTSLLLSVVHETNIGYTGGLQYYIRVCISYILCNGSDNEFRVR